MVGMVGWKSNPKVFAVLLDFEEALCRVEEKPNLLLQIWGPKPKPKARVDQYYEVPSKCVITWRYLYYEEDRRSLQG